MFHLSRDWYTKVKQTKCFFIFQVKILRVYPDDKTDVNMSHDINNHISLGNKKLPKEVKMLAVKMQPYLGHPLKTSNKPGN